MNVLWNNKLLKLNLSLINSKVKDNHEITTQKQKRIFFPSGFEPLEPKAIVLPISYPL